MRPSDPKAAPFPNAPELTGMLIDEVYEKYAERGGQKRYEVTLDDVVDETITSIHFKHDESTSWWDVTDALTQAEKTKARPLSRFYFLFKNEILNRVNCALTYRFVSR